MSTKFRFTLVALVASACALVAGCSYGGVASVNENTVVIVKNNSFLFGATRTVYVCKVSDAGLTSCAENYSP